MYCMPPTPRIPPKSEEELIERATSNAQALATQYRRAWWGSLWRLDPDLLKRETANVENIICTYPERVRDRMRTIALGRKKES